jgi:hypothetical protein
MRPMILLRRNYFSSSYTVYSISAGLDIGDPLNETLSKTLYKARIIGKTQYVSYLNEQLFYRQTRRHTVDDYDDD